MVKRNTCVMMITLVSCLLGWMFLFTPDVAASGLGFSVKSDKKYFAAGQEVTVTVQLDGYGSNAAKTIGSLSLEVPLSTGQYDLMKGSQKILATDGEFSNYKDALFFLYNPDATTAAGIKTLPKNTTALFSFKIKLKSGVSDSGAVTIPLREVIVGDADNRFIEPFCCNSQGLFYHMDAILSADGLEGSRVLGDINGDYVVDAVDALQALRHAVKLITLAGGTFIQADVNQSKAVDAADALLILQYSVGKITVF